MMTAVSRMAAVGVSSVLQLGHPMSMPKTLARSSAQGHAFVPIFCGRCDGRGGDNGGYFWSLWFWYYK
ncbi:MAG: hypothetical protein AABZ06_04630 [Bdellovibrionota bacterium]